jgi:hypothetical protein
MSLVFKKLTLSLLIIKKATLRRFEKRMLQLYMQFKFLVHHTCFPRLGASLQRYFGKYDVLGTTEVLLHAMPKKCNMRPGRVPSREKGWLTTAVKELD